MKLKLAKKCICGVSSLSNKKNSICLVACVASAISTRKIISILTDKKAEIILTPTITF